MAHQSQTGTRDVTYDLVSVLNHALQAADACEQYLQDARETGERELEAFLRHCQAQQRGLAERAKNLLTARLGAFAPHPAPELRRSNGPHLLPLRELKTMTNASVLSGGRPGDSLVDQLSKESFPASDAPGGY